MKQKKNDETYYETLIAKDIIEDNAEDAIKFAIEEKKVNNIAITGPYSSGKSSTIQSYFNKNINKKKYLNISLATFEVSKGEKEKRNEKNESDEDEENIAKNSKIESNLIEKIIIEKLYYSSLKKMKFEKERKQITLEVLIMLSIHNLVFNLEEIEGIIVSNLSVKIKEICIEMVNEHETEDFSESLSQNISTVIVKKEFKDKLSKQNLLKVISKLKDIELKIRVINLNFATITRENVKDFLEQLGEEYKNIIIDKKRPTVNKSGPNVLLLENIKKLGYNIKYEIVDNIIKLKGTNR